MGILTCSDGRPLTLVSRMLAGRSPACQLHIPNRRVSGEHALLRWAGDGWWIRDLGSRNGTTVGGNRLAPGDQTALPVGSEIEFGGVSTWRLVSAAAPVAEAWDEASRSAITGDPDLLVLPDEDNPKVCLFPQDGTWIAEVEAEVREVGDGEWLEVDGRRYRLHLPPFESQSLEGTIDAAPAMLEVASLRLTFRVSADEEYVELTATDGFTHLDLGSRAHHYTLLCLARARLEDADEVEASRGWVYHEDLSKMLGCDASKVNLDIHRARRQLAGAGVEGAAGLVERRVPTRQLRLGVSSIDVVTI